MPIPMSQKLMYAARKAYLVSATGPVPAYAAGSDEATDDAHPSEKSDREFESLTSSQFTPDKIGYQEETSGARATITLSRLRGKPMPYGSGRGAASCACTSPSFGIWTIHRLPSISCTWCQARRRCMRATHVATG